MKHINILKTVVLVCLFVGLFACNEDKGNYDYVAVNSVDSINGVDDVSRVLGEELQIEPKLVFSEGEDESNFSFNWYYYNENGVPVFLQEGRNLDIVVEDPFDQPKNYTLAYEITNLTTEISYHRIFTLSVVSPYVKGYLALCEEEGGFDIDMLALSTKEEFNFYDNLLDLTESTLPRDGVKPLDIVTFVDPFAPNPVAITGNYSMYILTDQYTTRIKQSDYSWDPSYDISNIVEKGSYLDREYVKQGKPVIARKMVYAYNVNPLTPRMVLVYHQEDNGQGNWYMYSTSMMSLLLSVQMNRLRPNGELRYEPAPFAAPGNRGGMYFDVDKKKFMYNNFVEGYQTSQLYYTDSIPADESGPFKFNDPNEGLLYMDQVPNNSNGNGYAILKQEDGSFKYIEFYNRNGMATMATGTDAKIRVSTIPASSGIGNAKFFARMPEEANVPFLYYVTNDNKVYLADVSNATAVIYDLTSEVLKGDGYNEITVFKFTLPESDGVGGSMDNALAVGTYNSSLGKDKGGKLEFFKQETEHLVLAKYPDEPDEETGYQIDMSWKDLGRIVGLSYKKQ